LAGHLDGTQLSPLTRSVQRPFLNLEVKTLLMEAIFLALRIPAVPVQSSVTQGHHTLKEYNYHQIALFPRKKVSGLTMLW
jgi:hypothetical protein